MTEETLRKNGKDIAESPELKAFLGSLPKQSDPWKAGLQEDLATILFNTTPKGLAEDVSAENSKRLSGFMKNVMGYVPNLEDEDRQEFKQTFLNGAGTFWNAANAEHPKNRGFDAKPFAHGYVNNVLYDMDVDGKYDIGPEPKKEPHASTGIPSPRRTPTPGAAP